MDKVPYLLIVGEKEQRCRTVSVRWRDAPKESQEMGEMSLKELMGLCLQTGYDIP